MSVKKQIHSLYVLYSFYEEVPEEVLDKTDVDRYFHYNIFDILQSQHGIVRVGNGSSKKCHAIKLFEFCELKTKQPHILQKEVKISKRKLSFLIDSLRNFLTSFDEAKCLQIPIPQPKIEIGSTKRKNNLFAHFYNYITEHPNRQIRLSSRFGNKNSSVFSIKKFELHGNHFILT